MCLNLTFSCIFTLSSKVSKVCSLFRWIHCAHIACIRNSIRGRSKQFPFIREIEDPTTYRCCWGCLDLDLDVSRTQTYNPGWKLGLETRLNFLVRYDGSELLKRLTEGHSPETHPHLYTQHCWDVSDLLHCFWISWLLGLWHMHYFYSIHMGLAVLPQIVTVKLTRLCSLMKFYVIVCADRKPRMCRGDCLPRVLPPRLRHPPPPRQEDAQALPSPPQRHLPLWRVRHQTEKLSINILDTSQILRWECAAHELRCRGPLCRQVAARHRGRHWQVQKGPWRVKRWTLNP